MADRNQQASGGGNPQERKPGEPGVDHVDEATMESFPASDPPSFSSSRTGPARKKNKPLSKAIPEALRTEAEGGHPNPPQHQDRQPGLEKPMHPAPRAEARDYTGSGKLKDRIALITGGDSGIGRSVAIHFAKEGARIAIVYLDEHEDADTTARCIEEAGGECLLLCGDLAEVAVCERVMEAVKQRYGRLDVLVNNAAEQHVVEKLEDLDREQLERTFATNLYSIFELTKRALPLMKEGASIVNTTSVTAYHGNPKLLDYSATKGAIVAFTRSLSQQLAERGIRVNAVAPGPVWTPLIPSTFSEEDVAKFGSGTPMKRPGQPDEIAPSFVFLACKDSAYMSGQVLHPNGGQIVNG